jgi:hypothetical protein
MSADEPLYTLSEARALIAEEAFGKICGSLGHDLHIIRSDERGRPPLHVACRFCHTEWDVEPCVRQARGRPKRRPE